MYQMWFPRCSAHKMMYRLLDAEVSNNQTIGVLPAVTEPSVWQLPGVTRCMDEKTVPQLPNFLCMNLKHVAENTRDEKNWVHFTSHESDYIVYSLMPNLIILRADFRSTKCSLVPPPAAGMGVSGLEWSGPLIPLRRLLNIAQTRRRGLLSWDHSMFPRAWPSARVKAQQMAIKHRSPADRMLLARGGTPGVMLDGSTTLFVAHVLVSKLLLPKTAALIEREHEQQLSCVANTRTSYSSAEARCCRPYNALFLAPVPISACRRFGKWHRADGRSVDHCAFLKHYDVVYLMMFYTISAVDGRGKRDPRFVVSHVSPLFAPPNRVHATSTIAFPMGLSKHGTDFFVSYGENDRFSSSFFISRADLLTIMMPCAANYSRALLDDERLLDLTARLTPHHERRGIWRKYQAARNRAHGEKSQLGETEYGVGHVAAAWAGDTVPAAFESAQGVNHIAHVGEGSDI